MEETQTHQIWRGKVSKTAKKMSNVDKRQQCRRLRFLKGEKQEEEKKKTKQNPKILETKDLVNKAQNRDSTKQKMYQEGYCPA